MATMQAPKQHRIVDHLTAVKLALQLAVRWTNLSERQRALLRTALESTNGLADELLDPTPIGATTRLGQSDTAADIVVEKVAVHA